MEYPILKLNYTGLTWIREVYSTEWDPRTGFFRHHVRKAVPESWGRSLFVDFHTISVDESLSRLSEKRDFALKLKVTDLHYRFEKRKFNVPLHYNI